MPRLTAGVESRRSPIDGAATRAQVSSERGAVLLETAVTLPIVLMICVGIFEFGRVYQTWQVLTNAAREGARVAAVGGTTDHDVEAAVRSYMAAERLGNAGAAPIAVNRKVRPGIEHRHRGHDSVSVHVYLARPGRAVREAGNHGRAVDHVSGRHHA